MNDQIVLAISVAIEYLERFTSSQLSKLVVRDLRAAQGLYCCGRMHPPPDQDRAQVLRSLAQAEMYIVGRTQAIPLRDLVLRELKAAQQ